MKASCKQGQFVTSFYKARQTNISCRICKYGLLSMIDTNLGDDIFRLCQVQWSHANFFLFPFSSSSILPAKDKQPSSRSSSYLGKRKKQIIGRLGKRIKTKGGGGGGGGKEMERKREEGEGEKEDVEWRGKMIRCRSETVIRAHNCLNAFLHIQWPGISLKTTCYRLAAPYSCILTDCCQWSMQYIVDKSLVVLGMASVSMVTWRRWHDVTRRDGPAVTLCDMVL